MVDLSVVDFLVVLQVCGRILRYFFWCGKIFWPIFKVYIIVLGYFPGVE